MRKILSKYGQIIGILSRLSDLQRRSYEINVVIFMILLVIAGVGLLYAAAIFD
jgi:hypothetical protein